MTDMMPCVDGTRAHHWRLEPPTPARPTVPARCLRCGAKRVYRAYLHEIEEDWRTRPMVTPGGRSRTKIAHLPF